MADLCLKHDGVADFGKATIWLPSKATVEQARAAPVSDLPPSYEQAQHLSAFRAYAHRNEEMARLIIVEWEEPGQCDLQVMTQVVTDHLRRHDTYHSWFEDRGDALVRHVLSDPKSIQMEPTPLGEMGLDDWRNQAMATPAPFEWDCFRFGILQRETGFTCFACIDHLHADMSVVPLLLQEVHAAYRALTDGALPLRIASAARYMDYCTNQRLRTAKMTLADPGVAEWVAFLQRNRGRMPAFPLALGLLEDRCLADYVTLDILDHTGAAAFAYACEASGARMLGGLLACAALTERALAGNGRYSVVTPASTRKSPQAFRMAGWCMGVVPIDFDVDAQAFPTLAATAQRIFEERLPLADTPIERVLELAADLPTIRPVATGGVMLSYTDADRLPSNPHLARVWQQVNGRTYVNRGMAAQVAIWFVRTQRGLSLMASYPANEIARTSMTNYVEMFQNICRQVAGASTPARVGRR